MFTGIVREKGQVISQAQVPGGLRLRIRAGQSLEGLRMGDSMAINGVCQTVVSRDQISLTVEALAETLARTTVGSWRAGDWVNLEPAVRPQDFLGGHLVTGHVDGVGTVQGRTSRAGDVLFRITAPGELLAQIYPRGSVAVDGISLTVVAVDGQNFSVALIPYTSGQTTLALRRAGDRVNVETDPIVKALQRLLGSTPQGRRLTEERLRELGFS